VCRQPRKFLHYKCIGQKQSPIPYFINESYTNFVIYMARTMFSGLTPEELFTLTRGLQSHYKDTTQSYDSHTYTYVHVYF
jgi:hypothetical protein